MPDGSLLESKASTTLDIHGIPISCSQAHVIDSLHEPSLMAIAPFCDDGMSVVFTKPCVEVINPEGKVILHGDRNFQTKLWEFHAPDTLQSPQDSPVNRTAQIHRIFHCPKQDFQLVKFFHAALCFPAESTLIRAIDHGFIRLPGLTSAMVRKFPQHSWATAAGHLDRTRQGILPSSALTDSDVTATAPQLDADSDGASLESTDLQEARIAVIDVTAPGTVYSDPTGQLLTKSARGHDYIMIVFSAAANYILPIPMKGRTADEHMRAFAVAHSFFRAHGFPANLHVMDNECAEDTKLFLANYNIKTQLVPPGNHRANRAERAIRTFKNHFIAAVNGLPASFPPGQWDRLLPQIELTLNLLRPCVSRPSISAWEAVNGLYDYHRHPIAPLGTPVLVFEAPDQRGSYAAHGTPGFYLGPSFAHYRCFTCWVSATRSVRITDTVSWHPIDDPFPESQPDQLLSRVRAMLASPASNLQPHSTNTALRSIDAALEAISGAPFLAIPRNLEGPHTPPGYLPFKLPDPFADRTPTQSGPVITQPQPPPRPEQAALPRVADSYRPHPHTAPATQPAADPRVAETPDATMGADETLGADPRVREPAEAPDLHVEAQLPPDFDNSTAPGPRRSSRAPKPSVWISNSVCSPYHPLSIPRVATWISSSVGSPYHPLSIPSAAVPLYSISTIAVPSMGKCLRGPDAPKWIKANETELLKHLEKRRSMEFVALSALPQGTRCHYWNAVPSIKSDADGNTKYRVRGCMNPKPTGLTYEDVAAQTAALLNIKILLNITVSEDRIWSTADIEDFYLWSGLKHPEFMRIPMHMIPQSIRDRYHFSQLYPTSPDHALVRVTGAIFGHPQAGKIAQDDLIPRLVAAGYHPVKDMPMVFSDTSRSTIFCLVVDDFGISSKTPEDTERLLNTLRQHYPITHDPLGRKFLGMRIHHDRSLRKLTVSMPNYIKQALERFNVSAPVKPVLTPLPYNLPNYGQKVQQPVEDHSPLATEAEKKLVQQVVGVLNYYARAIDYSMLVAVNKISSQQSAPTTKTMADLHHLLAYAACFPDASITYYPSKMQLIYHSDAAFLTESKARSRSATYCYLSLGDIDDPVNGGLDAHSSIMKNVVPSVAEAEYGTIFRCAQDATPIRNALISLGYPQPPTIIVTDNSVACGISNKTLKSKRSKSMDNKFNWIQDQIKLGNFQVIWRPGTQNLADFVSKSHPPQWHQHMRKLLLSGDPPFILRDMRPPA